MELNRLSNQCQCMITANSYKNVSGIEKVMGRPICRYNDSLQIKAKYKKVHVAVVNGLATFRKRYWYIMCIVFFLQFAPVFMGYLTNRLSLNFYLDFHRSKTEPVWYQIQMKVCISFQWRHNELYGISHHLPHDCLLNLLSRRRSKKISKLRFTGLCEGNPPVKGPVTRKMFLFDDVIMCLYMRYIPISL